MPKKNRRIALYPGTFDPITNGHLDIIQRATMLCDHLVVAIARNPDKHPLLSLEQRVRLVTLEVEPFNNGVGGGATVEVRPFDSLLMHFAIECGASMIVRGLRAVSDFEYEFQMAGMNHRLNDKIETVFLMASESQHFIASSLVKVIARHDGDVTSFVPARVKRELVLQVDRERKAARAKG